jgi:thioredoxin-like negative regulator of GroEL
MAPIFEQAATELEPDVRLIKVDSDAAPELLQRFSIQSIPTLMIVHRGREVARKSGVLPLPQLLAWTASMPTALKRDRASVDFRLITSRAIWTAIPSQTSGGSSFHRGGE